MAGELELAAQKLQRTVQSLPGSSPASELVVLPIKPFRGVLEWPAAGRLAVPVRRSNGIRSSARRPRRTASKSNRPTARPVRAIHDGRVAFADVFAGLGQLVIVDHGGLAFSLYGYLGSMAVTKGMAVAAGDAIGTAGRAPAGNSAVYFELRIDGHPVDPLQWLKAR